MSNLCSSPSNSVIDLDIATGEVDTVREQLQALVSKEGIDKEVALTLTRLHHRMETVIVDMKATYAREIDRLNHALDQVGLKAEVDNLTLRQTSQAEHIRQLQADNEHLHNLTAASSSRRR